MHHGPVELCVKSHLLRDFGFLHGFSVRQGGVSVGPFASLNLGRSVGDDPAAVAENHRRLADSVGYDPDKLFEVHQAHGSDVVTVTPADEPSAIRARRADALVGLDGATVGVRVADCVPILIGDPASRAVAAVHAGWRGAVAGVIGEAVDALEHAGSAKRAHLVAAVGPHIRVDAFEVGDEVAHQLAATTPDRDVVDRSRDRPHVDLSVVVRAALEMAGLSPDRIDDAGGCTQHEEERFFSYRRQGGVCGRHLAVIASR